MMRMRPACKCRKHRLETEARLRPRAARVYVISTRRRGSQREGAGMQVISMSDTNIAMKNGIMDLLTFAMVDLPTVQPRNRQVPTAAC